ncbi:LytTR family DNA-binding domain-containing protein [Cellulophaga lytica]|uniref:LytR/AlgR family response regulator transcription factor n=1 Tax=Cellulophaga lytica TaxID=979 RepID=UPI0026E1A232|nr:LytTR family DNA-binding domain-containing protein [Cellulophaga lytica]MDO6852919.1 LytTR family DNA-binding domain-containing protein [Cellulophaga lytica]
MTTKIKCIIVDDEPAAHYVLSDYINKNPFLSLEHQLYNGLEAMQYLTNNPVDLMFLDIDMPEVTGMELLKTLPNKPKTILTTAYREFALESYEYGVIDYLLKPIFYPRFLKAIAHFEDKNAIENSPEPKEEAKDISLKIGSDMVTILLDDILFTQSYGNYVKVYTMKRTYVATITTTELEKQLPSSLFVRSHKSYIVAINKIKTIDKDCLIIQQKSIPIGITYKREIMEIIKFN